MEPGNILVVDDNAANLKLIAFLLSSRGHSVRVAANAEEALAAIDRDVPEVILMDVQLPGMDGLSLTRKLRADPATAHVVIVAVTAYAMRGDEERALAAGCDDYVSKPIDTRSLPDRVAALLAATRHGGRGR